MTVQMEPNPRPELLDDSPAAARAAGLRYYADDRPGIRRRRCGRGFCYYAADGELIRDREQIERFRALAVPPAWKNVWITPLPHGHLQATGLDARDRKQYRYHAQWVSLRNRAKFNRLLELSHYLPAMRHRLDRDLSRRGLDREKVLATVVCLLETSLIRIGNVEYRRANQSFGLTTMRRHHLELNGTRIHFEFRGKSGKCHRVDLRDRRLARILNRILEIPGQELFHYLAEDGRKRQIESGDVNDYLAAISGRNFTAKDFRTWKATVLATVELEALGPLGNKADAKKKVREAVKRVAGHLGNRPPTCQKYYIHPDILDAYLDGTLPAILRELDRSPQQIPDGLSFHEAAVQRLLSRNR